MEIYRVMKIGSRSPIPNFISIKTPRISIQILLKNCTIFCAFVQGVDTDWPDMKKPQGTQCGFLRPVLHVDHCAAFPFNGLRGLFQGSDDGLAALSAFHKVHGSLYLG